jgi:hypothetical protein
LYQRQRSALVTAQEKSGSPLEELGQVVPTVEKSRHGSVGNLADRIVSDNRFECAETRRKTARPSSDIDDPAGGIYWESAGSRRNNARIAKAIVCGNQPDARIDSTGNCAAHHETRLPSDRQRAQADATVGRSLPLAGNSGIGAIQTV